MSGIDGVAGIGGVRGVAEAAAGAGEPPAADFAAAMARGVGEVNAAEQQVDAVATDLATGGDSEVHDLMAATTQAGLSVDLLSAVRDRAVQSYQEIMRLQL